MRSVWVLSLLAGLLLAGCAPLALRHLRQEEARPTPLPALPASASTPAQPATPGADSGVRASVPSALTGGGSAQSGERLFTVKGCAICHGTGAEGNVVGPGLQSTPLSVETVWTRVRAPTHPKMPPYGPRDLTDAEVEDIYRFLMSRARS